MPKNHEEVSSSSNGSDSGDQRKGLDEVNLASHDLFLERQTLTHRFIQGEDRGDLRKKYLKCREKEGELELRRWRLKNQYDTGTPLRERALDPGNRISRLRFWTNLLMIAVTLAVVFLGLWFSSGKNRPRTSSPHPAPSNFLEEFPHKFTKPGGMK